MFYHKDNAYCRCKPATHAFCPKCKEVREVELSQAKAAPGLEGAAVVCQACGATVATFYRTADPDAQPTPTRTRRLPHPPHPLRIVRL